jgi:ABC-type nitrate/sulfonate/bicarbonate transport system substrate-binding protein
MLFVFWGQNGLVSLKKRSLIVIAVVILIVAIVLSSFVYLNSQKTYSGSVESLTIGLFPNELNALIYVADNQQYFRDNGLAITIKNYSSVLNAVNGAINGEVNIATASEFVLVGDALTDKNILTFTTIDKVDQSLIIGLKEKGISNIQDLAGKKIGVFKGSVNEFYLGRFLELHNMNINQVTLVDASAKLVDFLRNGTVDAVITGQPNINTLENLFGNQITEFPAQSEQSAYYNALCTNSWATAHPELIKRFLNSLSQAEQYIINNPYYVKTIIQNRLNYTSQYIADIWHNHRFSLSLDQSLLLAMRDEAQWLISNHLTNATAVPKFLDYVYLDGLISVEPGAVNIID